MKRKRKKDDAAANREPARPVHPATLKLIDQMLAWRDMILKGRDLLPPHMIHRPDYDGYERRFAELVRLLREGTPEAWQKAEDLKDEIELDFTTDMAATTAEINERMVRFIDDLAIRVEEKKFELPEETRDAMDSILLPYQDEIREEMLGTLPIETRRQLEAEEEERQRQRREGE